MNAKSSSLKMSLLIAAALLAGGCSTIPAGQTTVVGGDGHVAWNGMDGPQLARLEVDAPVQAAPEMTTDGLPGHPIYGVFKVADPVRTSSANGASAGEIAFLRELANSDGDVTGAPVVTPSDTAVASR